MRKALARTDMRNVVLIPSQLLTGDLWVPQIAALRGVCNCFVADHTRSSTMANIAAGILERAPKEFILTGHGMGGFVAFEILRQAPQRVSKLVLISTLASADVPAQTVRRLNYLRLVEAGKFASVVEERLPMLLHPKRQEDAKLVGAIRKMALETGAEAFLRQQRAIMARVDSRDNLPDIKCPTLLVYGRHDGITTLAHQIEMLERIPGAKLEILEDSGHMVPLECPEEVNKLLLNWVSAPGIGGDVSP